MANKDFKIPLPDSDFDEVVTANAKAQGWQENVRGEEGEVKANPVKAGKYLADKYKENMLNIFIRDQTQLAANEARQKAYADKEAELKKKFKV